MPKLEHHFLFVSCQPGAESALKLEIAREHPNFRFAFSRPGFVTFKSPDEITADFELRSVFARAYGLSLGDSHEPEPEARARAAEEAAKGLAAGTGEKLWLHVWERDQETQPDPQADLLLRSSATFRGPGTPAPGDLVFDVILIDPAHWFFGCHRHSPFHSRDPGGKPAIELPAPAPSRAYLKLEEGLRWAGLEPKPGERAIEIGSSPGGASFALLARGLEVVGIDPADMDAEVLASKRFRHVRKGVLDVTRSDLGGPGTFDWLLLDMNVPPQIAFAALEHVLTLGVRPAHALLTLKLNRWRIAAEIPEFLAHLRDLGFSTVRATQLPSNRQEFFVVAVRRSVNFHP